MTALFSATRILTIASAAMFLGLSGNASFALTMKECSAKYKIAQADGSAKKTKWNDFRKAQCGPDATAEPDVSMAADEEPEPTSMKAPKGVKLPSAISSKYASEKPGKARMHTCVDAYRANKEKDTLGGLRWIQKGGGFYSICNAKLKAS